MMYKGKVSEGKEVNEAEEKVIDVYIRDKGFQ